MPKKPLPDHPEVLAKLWEECGRLLDAWEPYLARSRRIERELREASESLDRGDKAGVLNCLRHHKNIDELKRKNMVDVTGPSTRPYLVLEYVDFSNSGLGRLAKSQEWKEFRAGAEPGHHDFNIAHDFLIKSTDEIESHLELLRRLRRNIAAKYAGLMAGPPPRAGEPRLSVNVAEETVRLNGEVHHLDAGQAAVIKILADAKGLWVTRKKMKEICELTRPRPDRIIKRLPKVIRDYIEAGNSGYRLRWEELE